MQALLPAWPRGLPRVFRPLAVLKNQDRKLRLDPWLALARRTARQQAAIRCSNITGSWSELLYSNRADFNAMNTSNVETGILQGQNLQPRIPAGFFDAGSSNVYGKGITILARGIIGTTSTPTIIFQCRLGTTVGATQLGGTSVGVSAAIGTASGVSNKWWELRLDLTCYTPGQGTGNTTLSGAGYVSSPGGFATPFLYPLEPTTPDTATWTATIDNTLAQFFNLSATWSASSASNTITVKQLWCHGWN